MARRSSLVLALVVLAAALLALLGVGSLLGIFAVDGPPSDERDSLSFAGREGNVDATAAGGPRLEGQPLLAQGGAGGAEATSAAPVAGARITGRCVDAAGKAVAGARVLSIPDTNGKVFALEDLGRAGCPGFATSTDAEGRFVVPVSKAAPYHTVLADAPGFAFAGRGNLPIGSDVTLTLTRGRSMSGRVLDTKREPIAGARVRALLLTDTLQHTLEARSGADGAYRLEGLPAEEPTRPGDWIGFMQAGWVEVTAEGYAPLTVPLQRVGAAWKEPQDWILARGATLAGRVEDAETGKPIAAATVVVHSIEGLHGYSRGGGVSYSNPWAPRLLAQRTSDQAGTFTVEHLPCDGPQGNASSNALASGKRALGGVSAWAPGYAAASQDLELAADGTTLEATIALWPARRIVGRVVEEGGGAVAGVSVGVSVEGRPRGGWIPPIVGEAPTAWAQSGEDGRFAIVGAPGSRQGAVEMKLAAHELGSRGGGAPPRKVELTIRVEGEQALDVGDLVLPPRAPTGPVTRVRVLTPDGRPYYGATVGQGGWGGGGTRTDAEGLVEVPWAAPREGQAPRPRHMLAQAPGFAPTAFTLPPPSEAGGGEVTVTLESGHRVEGRVLQPDGAPAAAGTMVLIGDGRLPADAAIPPRDQAFQRMGQIPAEGGRPTMYAFVYVDADGRFGAKDLPAGPYHVRSFGTRRAAVPPGTPPLQVTLSEVASDTLDLVVRLPEDDSPQTGGLLVRVLDAATREPVLDATVFARVDGRVVGTAGSRGVPGGPPPPPPSSRPPAVEPSGPGAEPGTYRLTNLPVGRVTLEVVAHGRRTERLADVEVVADRIAPTPDVRLGRGACVLGRIVPPRGEKLEGHQVHLVEEGAPYDAPPASAPVSSDGSFSVCGLGPGRYAVRCLPQGFNPQARVWIPAQVEPLVVAPGALEVTLEGTWLVAGIVALQPDDARLPPAPWDGEAATVERTRFGAATRVTLTDAQGRTLVDAQPVHRRWLGNVGFQYLPPGRYLARIQFPDGEAREETVTLEAGSQANVAFRKKP